MIRINTNYYNNNAFFNQDSLFYNQIKNEKWFKFNHQFYNLFNPLFIDNNSNNNSNNNTNNNDSLISKQYFLNNILALIDIESNKYL